MSNELKTEKLESVRNAINNQEAQKAEKIISLENRIQEAKQEIQALQAEYRGADQVREKAILQEILALREEIGTCKAIAEQMKTENAYISPEVSEALEDMKEEFSTAYAYMINKASQSVQAYENAINQAKQASEQMKESECYIEDYILKLNQILADVSDNKRESYFKWNMFDNMQIGNQSLREFLEVPQVEQIRTAYYTLLRKAEFNKI